MVNQDDEIKIKSTTTAYEEPRNFIPLSTNYLILDKTLTVVSQRDRFDAREKLHRNLTLLAIRFTTRFLYAAERSIERHSRCRLINLNHSCFDRSNEAFGVAQFLRANRG